ncbi:MAG TPA: MOSC domain-containing protein, partial [Terriglobia bacterium]|nr:MOSC domain-containing protein [Terriglobia bacterium]
PLFLLHDHRGSYDAAPVSLISRQTVARIAEECGVPEDPWRYRPNLLINLENGKAFDELNWAGRILRVGNEARISVTEVNVRCMMINLDPKDAKTSPEVLRSVAQQHGKCAGVYATVLTVGRIGAGDRVVFEN